MATALMTAPTETSWVDRLRAEGAEGRAAVAELHALLLKAARFEVGRRGAELAHLRGGDQEDLAQQAADDALMAVLRKLGEFRGESRFTTWAYKFACWRRRSRCGGGPGRGARSRSRTRPGWRSPTWAPPPADAPRARRCSRACAKRWSCARRTVSV